MDNHRWVQRSGTLFPMNSEIHNVVMTAINSFLRHFSFYTSVTSALEVSFELIVLYKLTFYLLIYLQNNAIMPSF